MTTAASQAAQPGPLRLTTCTLTTAGPAGRRSEPEPSQEPEELAAEPEPARVARNARDSEWTSAQHAAVSSPATRQRRDATACGRTDSVRDAGPRRRYAHSAMTLTLAGLVLSVVTVLEATRPVTPYWAARPAGSTAMASVPGPASASTPTGDPSSALAGEISAAAIRTAAPEQLLNSLTAAAGPLHSRGDGVASPAVTRSITWVWAAPKSTCNDACAGATGTQLLQCLHQDPGAWDFAREKNRAELLEEVKANKIRIPCGDRSLPGGYTGHEPNTYPLTPDGELVCFLLRDEATAPRCDVSGGDDELTRRICPCQVPPVPEPEPAPEPEPYDIRSNLLATCKVLSLSSLMIFFPVRRGT